MSLTVQVLHAIKNALGQASPAVLVTVTAVKGSAPRGVGTSMLVLPSSIVSTIGGGRLEFVAIEKARAAVKQSGIESIGEPFREPFREQFPLGDRLGQCCGGSVELLFEPVQGNWQQWVNAAIGTLEKGDTYERVVDEHYSHTIEPLSSQLLLCGAGHVGRAVVKVLSDAPVRIHWVDERADEFPDELPSNVYCEVTDTASALVQQAEAGSAVLITTHRHDLDFELTGIAITQTNLAYCGMIGSASKRARFERQWRQRYSGAGQSDEPLSRLVCPIGGTALSGKEPEIVAIAVAYEVLNALQTWHASRELLK